jgi:hypothetical protein
VIPTKCFRPGLAAVLLAVTTAGCGHDTGSLGLAKGNTDPLIFSDNFGTGIDYQAFLGSKLSVLSVDNTQMHSGTASLKVTVPGPSDPAGGYAGGAMTSQQARDPSGYNALTFWAKASKAATLDVAGVGNDNTGTSKYQASWANIPLTTNWTKYVIPIPLTGKMRVERGMFYFAEGPEGGTGYTLWFDDIMFETVDTITNPRPGMQTRTVGAFVGSQYVVPGTRTTFNVDGTDQVVEHFPAYFTFYSSDESVAKPGEGFVQVVGAGGANLTASLGTVSAIGTVTLIATSVPPNAAPTPTLPAGDVISLFSNAYSNVPVDTWSATWDVADVADLKVAGNDTKGYTNLVYAGVEFISHPIDATAMTHFHLDVWTESGSIFKVKLVDFGADGVYGGGDDREQELSFNGATTPPLTVGNWSNLDIPLANFTALTTRAHVAQLIIEGDPGTVFLDNVYFHK